MTNAWAEKKLSKDDVIAILNSRGYKSLSSLARDAGYPSVYLFQKEYKDHIPAKGDKINIRHKRIPREVVSYETTQAALPEVEPDQEVFENLDAWVMRFIGTVLGAAGLALNYRYNSTQGQESADAAIMAAIGLGVDMIAIVLPQGFFRLLEKRHRILAFFCAIIWLGCFFQSLNTGINFSATHKSDARQMRADLRNQSIRLNEALEAKKRDRADLARARTSDEVDGELVEAENAVPLQNWRSSGKCTDNTISLVLCSKVRSLRAEKDGAMSSAERRAKIDKVEREISEASSKLAALPPISIEDPGGELWTPWMRAIIDKTGTFIMASMPSLAGFLFAFARKVSR